MTLPVVFRRAARREFDEAALWYEERRAGLASQFVSEINYAIKWCWKIHSLSDHAPRDSMRSSASLPLLGVFRAEAQRIVVLAVFHARRDPSVWHDRA